MKKCCLSCWHYSYGKCYLNRNNPVEKNDDGWCGAWHNAQRSKY